MSKSPRKDVGTPAAAIKRPPRARKRKLPPEAQRALAEAAERRAAQNGEMPAEDGGRGGLEPTRYGDWEVKGIASDF